MADTARAPVVPSRRKDHEDSIGGSGRRNRWDLGSEVGSIGLRAAGGLIVATHDGLVFLDTATGASKPAKLETGATVQVPLFVNIDDVIRIDTRDRRYIRSCARRPSR